MLFLLGALHHEALWALLAMLLLAFGRSLMCCCLLLGVHCHAIISRPFHYAIISRPPYCVVIATYMRWNCCARFQGS